MATVTAKLILTPDDILAMPEGGKGYELIGGSLVEKNVGAESGWIAGCFIYFLTGFQRDRPTGLVFPSESGFQCFQWEPGRVRKPDASFVRFGRLPGEKIPTGYLRIAPDLAVEVVSPNDLAYEVEEKLSEYLRAGVRIVWIVYPESRTIQVHRPDGAYRRLTEDDELDGEDVLPGFRRPVRDFFPPRPAAEGVTP